MNDKFEPLEWNEVVCVNSSDKILIQHSTFKVSELAKAAMSIFKGSDNVTRQGWTEEKEKWVGDGVECEVLKYGAKSWQKGKVRITLEFCPDEPEVEETPISNHLEISPPESPLDDLRRMMNENSQ